MFNKSTVKSTVTLGAALDQDILDNERSSQNFCRMTPTHVPEQFDRTMGCTAAELISWLPRSLPDAQLAVDDTLGRCVASWPEGSLRLQWSPLPDRCIALLRIPQLQVHFAFEGLDDAARYARQKFFDLHTHRGGG